MSSHASTSSLSSSSHSRHHHHSHHTSPDSGVRWKGKERVHDDDLHEGVLEPPSTQPAPLSSNTRRTGQRRMEKRRAGKRALNVTRTGERREWDEVGLKKRAPAMVEGAGGNDGIVLPMTMVGGGVYDVAYVLPISIGRNSPRTFHLQVDSGSSDTWIASSSCSTASCQAIGTSSSNLYNPSSNGGTETGVDFAIQYLQGSVSGPVFWDRVTIGGYSIENQAVAAASSVDAEPLSPQFQGILGLALPLNSIIAQSLPPVTTNDPDGAAWASNLFSITPTRNAPSRRFISMLLERPGASEGGVGSRSVLGIGRHPEWITGRRGVVEYSTLLAESTGTLFWKTSVRAITVYAPNPESGQVEAREVELGRGVSGGVFPSAVVDSGVPLILARSEIANAIWGAVGVNPAEDGMYYIPCQTPLNMTLQLDARTPIALHPLDLTALPPVSPNSGPQHQTFGAGTMCMGLIQNADAFLGQRGNAIGDMILGVPFMRSVYSVMAYVAPGPGGEFSNPFEGLAEGEAGEPMITQPQLGLMGLTDPAVALAEFTQVRVDNRPLGGAGGAGAGGSGAGGGGRGNPTSAQGGGRRLSVGIIVLISLVAFFALCMGLFGVRWWMMRRRYRRNEKMGSDGARANAFVLAGLGGKPRRREDGGGTARTSSVGASTPEDGDKEDEKRLREMMLGLGGGGYELARLGTGGTGKTKATLPPQEPAETNDGKARRVSDDSVYSQDRESKKSSVPALGGALRLREEDRPKARTQGLGSVDSRSTGDVVVIGSLTQRAESAFAPTSVGTLGTLGSSGGYAQALVEGAGIGVGSSTPSTPGWDSAEDSKAGGDTKHPDDPRTRVVKKDSTVLPSPRHFMPVHNNSTTGGLTDSMYTDGQSDVVGYRLDSYYGFRGSSVPAEQPPERMASVVDGSGLPPPRPPRSGSRSRSHSRTRSGAMMGSRDEGLFTVHSSSALKKGGMEGAGEGKRVRNVSVDYGDGEVRGEFYARAI